MGVETVSEIISTMKAVAPPGQRRLGAETLRRLGDLTQSLIAVSEGAAAEHARFLSIAERGLCLPETKLADRLRGVTVLVTGGTGCIGSTLIAQLAARCPGRLVSVSRGVTNGRLRHAAAEYRHADVRDDAAMAELIGDVRPDLVFHLAAQRDPGLAEIEVHRTVSTNVLGTRSVLAAAAAAGDMLCAAGRFTHVLDNSIIYQRLLSWAGEPQDGAIRLHGTDIAFYVQSALESAQLLLLACLGSRRGEFRVHAISDPGWPVSLLDLALAVLARSGSPTPIYVSGYDRGYEEIPFPGLYDPLTAGDVSPLLNAFEASAVVGSPCPLVDAFRVDIAAEPEPAKLLDALAEVCDRTQDPDAVRSAMNELSWSLLDASLSAAPPRALTRSAAMALRHSDSMGADHRRVLEAILDHADAANPRGLISSSNSRAWPRVGVRSLH